MDDLQLDEPRLYQTLRELDFINETLGGNQISIKAFKNLLSSEKEISVMDMGTGSGNMLRKMAKICDKQNISFEGTGIDANPHITQYAAYHTDSSDHIVYRDVDVFDDACYEKKVDIIHACLFTHHFSEDQLVGLFQQWKRTANKAVIINDLHRDTIAYYGIKWLTQLFSKSSMVRYDAPLSVARGFSRHELEVILKTAGITNYTLRWKWAFRWLLIF